MISKAKATYIRISPRKVRDVLDLVRNKTVLQAYSILSRTNRRPAPVVYKLVKSAVDSAEKNKSAKVEDLYISKITADQAGMLKRWRSMSMGRAGSIHKRLTHINVELDQLKKTKTNLVQNNASSTEAKKDNKKLVEAAK